MQNESEHQNMTPRRSLYMLSSFLPNPVVSNINMVAYYELRMPEDSCINQISSGFRPCRLPRITINKGQWRVSTTCHFLLLPFCCWNTVMDCNSKVSVHLIATFKIFSL